MKNKILLMFLFIFLVITLVGCSKKSAEEEKQEVKGTKDELSLVAAYTYDSTVENSVLCELSSISKEEQYVFLVVDIDSSKKDIKLDSYEDDVRFVINDNEYKPSYNEKTEKYLEDLYSNIDYFPLTLSSKTLTADNKITRAIIAFKVKYKDLVDGEEAKLTYKFNKERTGDYSINGEKILKVKSIKTITYLDALLSHEDDYKEKQMVAALRWKLESAFIMTKYLDRSQGWDELNVQCISDPEAERFLNHLSSYFENNKKEYNTITTDLYVYHSTETKSNEPNVGEADTIDELSGLEYETLEKKYPGISEKLQKLDQDGEKMMKKIIQNNSKYEVYRCLNIDDLKEYKEYKEDISALSKMLN